MTIFPIEQPTDASNSVVTGSVCDLQAQPQAQSHSQRPQLSQFYTYAEVAEAFGRKPRTIRSWVAAGLLQAVRIGGARLISEAELARFTDKVTAEEGGFDASLNTLGES